MESINGEFKVSNDTKSVIYSNITFDISKITSSDNCCILYFDDFFVKIKFNTIRIYKLNENKNTKDLVDTFSLKELSLNQNVNLHTQKNIIKTFVLKKDHLIKLIKLEQTGKFVIEISEQVDPVCSVKEIGFFTVYKTKTNVLYVSNNTKFGSKWNKLPIGIY